MNTKSGVATVLFFVALMVLWIRPADAQVDPWVSIKTDCGTGKFSFEPLPANYPHGVIEPVTSPQLNYSPYCVTPGAIITVRSLFTVYPHARTVTKVELGFYHRRLRTQSNGTQIWDLLAGPTFVNLPNFITVAPDDLPRNWFLEAEVPFLTGKVPTAVVLRITFRQANGLDRTIVVNKRPSLQQHDLFYIPTYGVYFAAKKVNIGWDLFSRTVTGQTMPIFNQLYPRGWQKYCTIAYVSISKPGFPGSPRFRSPCTYQGHPNQGYEVNMPGGTSGSFNVIQQVLCPVGVTPAGAEFFNSWSLVGYHHGLDELKTNYGMPPKGLSFQDSVAGSCD